MPSGAGYTEYHAEIIIMHPFGEQTRLCYKPHVKLQHDPSMAKLIPPTILSCYVVFGIFAMIGVERLSN